MEFEHEHVKQDRIPPERMGDMYFNRMHFSAITAVIAILQNHPVESETGAYWRAVLRHIRLRVADVNQKKKPRSGNA